MRGLGAAPLGIASGFLTSGGLAWNLARLYQHQMPSSLDLGSAVRGDEVYKVIVDFTLVHSFWGGWELSEMKIRYEFRDKTQVHGKQFLMADDLQDGGVVTWRNGHWQGGPAGWKPPGDPKISLDFGRASNGKRSFKFSIRVLHPLQATGRSVIRSPMGEVLMTCDHGREHIVPKGPAFANEMAAASKGQNSPIAQLMVQTQQAMKNIGKMDMGSRNETMSWEQDFSGTAWGTKVAVDETNTVLTGAQSYQSLEIMLPGALKANAGGPYTVVRGSRVPLNGLRSTGDVKTYKWSFYPVGHSVKLAAGAEKEGARAGFVALQTVGVELTVSDGRHTSTDRTVVHVLPRRQGWKTPFHEDPKIEKIPVPNPLGLKMKPYVVDGYESDPRKSSWVGGYNLCSIDGLTASNPHIFHPPSSNRGSWAHSGYITDQVRDPGGPFDGRWYIAQYLLKVERTCYINPYLLKGGPPPLPGIEDFYEANKRLGHKVDKYIEGIDEHERMHGSRIEKNLRIYDPAGYLEADVALTRGELVSAADKRIKYDETEICLGSGDPLPKTFEGVVTVPEDDTYKYQYTGSIIVGGKEYMMWKCN